MATIGECTPTHSGIALNLSTRDVAHLLKSGKVYLLRLPEFSCLKPQL